MNRARVNVILPVVCGGNECVVEVIVMLIWMPIINDNVHSSVGTRPWWDELAYPAQYVITPRHASDEHDTLVNVCRP